MGHVLGLTNFLARIVWHLRDCKERCFLICTTEKDWLYMQWIYGYNTFKWKHWFCDSMVLCFTYCVVCGISTSGKFETGSLRGVRGWCIIMTDVRSVVYQDSILEHGSSISLSKKLIILHSTTYWVDWLNWLKPRAQNGAEGVDGASRSGIVPVMQATLSQKGNRHGEWRQARR